MRITESRLRKIIRSVIKESFALPPSQSYSKEGEEIVSKWLESAKGQNWWSQAKKGKEVRGVEVKITNQDLKSNKVLFGNIKPVCLLSGKAFKPGDELVIIQPEGSYSTIGYVVKEHCKKYAQDLFGV